MKGRAPVRHKSEAPEGPSTEVNSLEQMPAVRAQETQRGAADRPFQASQGAEMNKEPL